MLRWHSNCFNGAGLDLGSWASVVSSLVLNFNNIGVLLFYAYPSCLGSWSFVVLLRQFVGSF